MTDDLKWAAGVIGAAFVFLWTHLIKSNDTHEKKRAELWEAHEKLRTANDTFREMVLRDLATKSDVLGMKKELMSAINARREPWSEHQRREHLGDGK